MEQPLLDAPRSWSDCLRDWSRYVWEGFKKHVGLAGCLYLLPIVPILVFCIGLIDFSICRTNHDEWCVLKDNESNTSTAFIGQREQYTTICDPLYSDGFNLNNILNKDLPDEFEHVMLSPASVVFATITLLEIAFAFVSGPTSYIPDLDSWIPDTSDPGDRSRWRCPTLPLVRLGNLIPDIEVLKAEYPPRADFARGSNPAGADAAWRLSEWVGNGKSSRQKSRTPFGWHNNVNALQNLPHRVIFGDIEINLPWKSKYASFVFAGQLAALVYTIFKMSRRWWHLLLSLASFSEWWSYALLFFRIELLLPLAAKAVSIRLSLLNIDVFCRGDDDLSSFLKTTFIVGILFVSFPTLYCWAPAVIVTSLLFAACIQLLHETPLIWLWKGDSTREATLLGLGLLCIAAVHLISHILLPFLLGFRETTYLCPNARIPIFSLYFHDQGQLAELVVRLSTLDFFFYMVAWSTVMYLLGFLCRAASLTSIPLGFVFGDESGEDILKRWYRSPMYNRVGLQFDIRDYNRHRDHFLELPRDHCLRECKYCEKFGNGKVKGQVSDDVRGDDAVAPLFGIKKRRSILEIPSSSRSISIC